LRQEDVGVAAEADDALLDACAARVVEADERDPHPDGEVHDLHDLLGEDLAERSAEDREVLAEDAHGRPSIVPCPVTTPSPGYRSSSTPKPVARWSAKASVSTNEPSSSSRSMRSRAVSFPRSCWRATASGRRPRAPPRGVGAAPRAVLRSCRASVAPSVRRPDRGSVVSQALAPTRRSGHGGRRRTVMRRAVVRRRPRRRSTLGENRIVRERCATSGGRLDAGRHSVRSHAPVRPTGTVVIADRQTAGRGRRGTGGTTTRPGASLALSLLLDVGATPSSTRHPSRSSRTRSGSRSWTAAVLGPDAAALRLKWPNDVVVGRPDRRRPQARRCARRTRADRGSGPVSVRSCCAGSASTSISAAAPRTASTSRPRSASVRTERLLLAALLMALDAALRALATPGELLDRYRRLSDTSAVGPGAGPGRGGARRASRPASTTAGGSS
jgi:hypothetical protein